MRSYCVPMIMTCGIAQTVTKKDKSKMALVGQPVNLSRTPSRLAARLHAPVIEIHTGAWCDAVVDGYADKAEAE